MDRTSFLPVSRQDMEQRGWYYYDFLLVTGDAYVDHPSFGAAIIGRCLEAAGFRVAVLAQPEWHTSEAFASMGRPRYAALVTAGNIDSMVAHYTAAKKHRRQDVYSPGGIAGKRPDRATIVYTGRIKEAFPGLPVLLGGLEASLRRFTHYDYWEDRLRRPILIDSGADGLMYGMGENQIAAVGEVFRKGGGVEDLRNERGFCFVLSKPDSGKFPSVILPSHEEQASDKRRHAEAAMTELAEFDHVRGRALIEPCGNRFLLQTPPALPLTTARFDRVYELPYARTWHPMYEAAGGVPAISEVEFSVIHNRGCFGGCNFCSLAFHQGRFVSARSHESVLREIEGFTKKPNFKGYVHDIGGPTANFRRPACARQKTRGLCRDKRCLFPEPCPSIDASHADYLRLLRRASAIPGVKKVFIRSGLRYDYMMHDRDGTFFSELVKNHISGQLKVAPEHISDRVLYYMGKPSFSVYRAFSDRFRQQCEQLGKKQYLVPYLMSSHPGSELSDAIELACYLKKIGHMPEQVQDFYPTPGTLSTTMYYTGLDPRTMKPVYVPRSPEEKAMQRALLQWRLPRNRELVEQALRRAGREDLIGYGKHCLIPPAGHTGVRAGSSVSGKRSSSGKAPRRPEGKPKRRPSGGSGSRGKRRP